MRRFFPRHQLVPFLSATLFWLVSLVAYTDPRHQAKDLAIALLFVGILLVYLAGFLMGHGYWRQPENGYVYSIAERLDVRGKEVMFLIRYKLKTVYWDETGIRVSVIQELPQNQLYCYDGMQYTTGGTKFMKWDASKWEPFPFEGRVEIHVPPPKKKEEPTRSNALP